MWRPANSVADAKVHLRLAEPERDGLGVDVRDVDNRQGAGAGRPDQVALGQALLGGETRPAPEA
jgi:hypothetical protein